MQTDGKECFKYVENNRFNRKKADNKTRFDPRRSTKELAPLKEAYLNNWIIGFLIIE